jgi:hypothetical protein
VATWKQHTTIGGHLALKNNAPKLEDMPLILVGVVSNMAPKL